MDKKRIFLILGFVALCILLGYAIYRVFFVRPQVPTLSDTQTTTDGGGTFPTIGEREDIVGTDGGGTTLPTDTGTTGGGGTPTTPTTPSNITTPSQPPSLITKVVNVDIANPSAGQGSTARFYNKSDGKFYTLDRNGNVQALSNTVFYNVDKVTWSPRADESIIEYPDGVNIYYNFNTDEQVTLPKHWESFSFSKEGSEISAKSIGLSPESKWLITADPTGKNINLVEPLGNNASRVIVDWSPNRQVLALSLTGDPIGGLRQEVLLVGQYQENFRSIEVEGRGLQTQWSPNGSKLLHSVYSSRNDYKPELWIVDATPDTAGENRKPLGVQTWASKCAMADERTVFCGVPERLESGAGFAPEVANFTPDIFYQIDTVTGIRTELEVDGSYVVDTMFVSQDGSTLNFTDKNQSGLFQIPLK